jgi:protein TonB
MRLTARHIALGTLAGAAFHVAGAILLTPHAPLGGEKGAGGAPTEGARVVGLGALGGLAPPPALPASQATAPGAAPDRARIDPASTTGAESASMARPERLRDVLTLGAVGRDARARTLPPATPTPEGAAGPKPARDAPPRFAQAPRLETALAVARPRLESDAKASPGIATPAEANSAEAPSFGPAERVAARPPPEPAKHSPEPSAPGDGADAATFAAARPALRPLRVPAPSRVAASNPDRLPPAESSPGGRAKTSQVAAGAEGGAPGAVDAAETGASADARQDYLTALQAWIAGRQRYPALALRRGHEGRGLLRVRIDAGGRLLDASLQRSTGHDALDAEMLAMIRRAAPLPPIPAALRVPALEVVVPVSFALR